MKSDYGLGASPRRPKGDDPLLPPITQVNILASGGVSDAGSQSPGVRGLKPFVAPERLVSLGSDIGVMQAYTPTITSTGGGETLTYTTRKGEWARLGGTMIWFAADITLATKVGGSADINISLPVTPTATQLNAVSVYIDTMGVTWTGAPLAVISGSVVFLRELVSGAATAAWTKLGATGAIRLSGIYRAAD